MDSQAFAAFPTPDAIFRFRNGPTIAGREVVQAAVRGFFKVIKGAKLECRDRAAGARPSMP
jgi:hypothetical protein